MKVLSILIIVTFSLQQISWAQGGSPALSRPAPAAFQGSEPPVLPYSLASTEDIYIRDGDELIINVQDAHASLSAQESIVEVLDSLVRDYDIGLIALEGSEGVVDTSILSTFPDARVRERTAHQLMSEGRLSAGEFYSIVRAPEDVALWGIEDEELYNSNLESFVELFRSSEVVLPEIDLLISMLGRLERDMYGAELRELIALSRSHKRGELAFSSYWKDLESFAERSSLDVTVYGELMLLSRVMELEGEIDFCMANMQREGLIVRLGEELGKVELGEFSRMSLDFAEGDISPGAFHAYLSVLAEDKGILREEHPDLALFTEYIGIYESMDIGTLLVEMEHLESKIRGTLYSGPEEKELYELSRMAQMLRKLHFAELSPRDTRWVEENLGLFTPRRFERSIREWSLRNGVSYDEMPDMHEVLESAGRALDFYRIAAERDSRMLANTVERMRSSGTRVAALVTGGYHTQGLTELMKKQNLSYLVIMPKFDAGRSRPYITVLTGRERPYRELAETGRYTLAVRAYFAGGGQNDLLDAFVYSMAFHYEQLGSSGEIAAVKELWKSAYRENFERKRTADGMTVERSRTPEWFDRMVDNIGIRRVDGRILVFVEDKGRPIRAKFVRGKPCGGHEIEDVSADEAKELISRLDGLSPPRTAAALSPEVDLMDVLSSPEILDELVRRAEPLVAQGREIAGEWVVSMLRAAGHRVPEDWKDRKEIAGAIQVLRKDVLARLGKHLERSHRFPRIINGRDFHIAFKEALVEEGLSVEEAKEVIRLGIYRLTPHGLVREEDLIVETARRTLSEVLGREVSLDAMKRAIIDHHELMHRVIDRSELNDFQERLKSELGEPRYAGLIKYYQNMYGDYEDELELLEELVCNYFMERHLNSEIRLLIIEDERWARITLDEFAPETGFIINEMFDPREEYGLYDLLRRYVLRALRLSRRRAERLRERMGPVREEIMRVDCELRQGGLHSVPDDNLIAVTRRMVPNMTRGSLKLVFDDEQAQLEYAFYEGRLLLWNRATGREIEIIGFGVREDTGTVRLEARLMTGISGGRYVYGQAVPLIAEYSAENGRMTLNLGALSFFEETAPFLEERIDQDDFATVRVDAKSVRVRKGAHVEELLDALGMDLEDVHSMHIGDETIYHGGYSMRVIPALGDQKVQEPHGVLNLFTDWFFRKGHSRFLRDLISDSNMKASDVVRKYGDLLPSVHGVLEAGFRQELLSDMVESVERAFRDADPRALLTREAFRERLQDIVEKRKALTASITGYDEQREELARSEALAAYESERASIIEQYVDQRWRDIIHYARTQEDVFAGVQNLVDLPYEDLTDEELYIIQHGLDLKIEESSEEVERLGWMGRFPTALLVMGLSYSVLSFFGHEGSVGVFTAALILAFAAVSEGTFVRDRILGLGRIGEILEEAGQRCVRIDFTDPAGTVSILPIERVQEKMMVLSGSGVYYDETQLPVKRQHRDHSEFLDEDKLLREIVYFVREFSDWGSTESNIREHLQRFKGVGGSSFLTTHMGTSFYSRVDAALSYLQGKSANMSGSVFIRKAERGRYKTMPFEGLVLAVLRETAIGRESLPDKEELIAEWDGWWLPPLTRMGVERVEEILQNVEVAEETVTGEDGRERTWITNIRLSVLDADEKDGALEVEEGMRDYERHEKETVDPFIHDAWANAQTPPVAIGMDDAKELFEFLDVMAETYHENFKVLRDVLQDLIDEGKVNLITSPLARQNIPLGLTGHASHRGIHVLRAADEMSERKMGPEEVQAILLHELGAYLSQEEGFNEALENSFRRYLEDQLEIEELLRLEDVLDKLSAEDLLMREGQIRPDYTRREDPAPAELLARIYEDPEWRLEDIGEEYRILVRLGIITARRDEKGRIHYVLSDVFRRLPEDAARAIMDLDVLKRRLTGEEVPPALNDIRENLKRFLDREFDHLKDDPLRLLERYVRIVEKGTQSELYVTRSLLDRQVKRTIGDDLLLHVKDEHNERRRHIERISLPVEELGTEEFTWEGYADAYLNRLTVEYLYEQQDWSYKKDILELRRVYRSAIEDDDRPLKGRVLRLLIDIGEDLPTIKGSAMTSYKDESPDMERFQDDEALAGHIAARIAEVVEENPRAVFIMPTGSTPTGLYAKLVDMACRKELDFSHVTIFMLDEYEGGTDYAEYIAENLLQPLPEDNRPEVNVLSGMPEEGLARLPIDGFVNRLSVEEYRRRLFELGGADLCLLGIGREGHIGFNEAGADLSARTRRIALSQETIGDNLEASEKGYTHAYTAGVSTILSSKEIILMANNPEKTWWPLSQLLYGKAHADCPATWLRLHANFTLMITEDVWSEIKRQSGQGGFVSIQGVLLPIAGLVLGGAIAGSLGMTPYSLLAIIASLLIFSIPAGLSRFRQVAAERRIEMTEDIDDHFLKAFEGNREYFEEEYPEGRDVFLKEGMIRFFTLFDMLKEGWTVDRSSPDSSFRRFVERDLGMASLTKIYSGNIAEIVDKIARNIDVEIEQDPELIQETRNRLETNVRRVLYYRYFSKGVSAEAISRSSRKVNEFVLKACRWTLAFFGAGFLGTIMVPMLYLESASLASIPLIAWAMANLPGLMVFTLGVSFLSYNLLHVNRALESRSDKLLRDHGKNELLELELERPDRERLFKDLYAVLGPVGGKARVSCVDVLEVISFFSQTECEIKDATEMLDLRLRESPRGAERNALLGMLILLADRAAELSQVSPARGDIKEVLERELKRPVPGSILEKMVTSYRDLGSSDEVLSVVEPLARDLRARGRAFYLRGARISGDAAYAVYSVLWDAISSSEESVRDGQGRDIFMRALESQHERVLLIALEALRHTGDMDTFGKLNKTLAREREQSGLGMFSVTRSPSKSVVDEMRITRDALRDRLLRPGIEDVPFDEISGHPFSSVTAENAFLATTGLCVLGLAAGFFMAIGIYGISGVWSLGFMGISVYFALAALRYYLLERDTFNLLLEKIEEDWFFHDVDGFVTSQLAKHMSIAHSSIDYRSGDLEEGYMSLSLDQLLPDHNMRKKVLSKMPPAGEDELLSHLRRVAFDSFTELSRSRPRTAELIMRHEAFESEVKGLIAMAPFVYSMVRLITRGPGHIPIDIEGIRDEASPQEVAVEEAMVPEKALLPISGPVILVGLPSGVIEADKIEEISDKEGVVIVQLSRDLSEEGMLDHLKGVSGQLESEREVGVTALLDLAEMSEDEAFATLEDFIDSTFQHMEDLTRPGLRAEEIDALMERLEAVSTASDQIEIRNILARTISHGIEPIRSVRVNKRSLYELRIEKYHDAYSSNVFEEASVAFETALASPEEDPRTHLGYVLDSAFQLRLLAKKIEERRALMSSDAEVVSETIFLRSDVVTDEDTLHIFVKEAGLLGVIDPNNVVFIDAPVTPEEARREIALRSGDGGLCPSKMALAGTMMKDREGHLRPMIRVDGEHTDDLAEMIVVIPEHDVPATEIYEVLIGRVSGRNIFPEGGVLRREDSVLSLYLYQRSIERIDFRDEAERYRNYLEIRMSA